MGGCADRTKALTLLSVRASVCVRAYVCVNVRATLTRAKTVLLLLKLRVFREEWYVRRQQGGLGFMKSINHRDSTTLSLSPSLYFSLAVTGNSICQAFVGFGAKCFGDS